MEQSLKRWRASAPSNIALIKYMGKSLAEENRPSNASLSWTLGHLRTHVEIEESSFAEDRWEPLKGEGLEAMTLSDAGKAKFLNHWHRLKKLWGLQSAYVVRSGNTFPADCGLASSASSFAALTMAGYEVARDTLGIKETPSSLSRVSRLGSGSSCRSFFAPWSIWELEGAHPIELPQTDLLHASVIIASGIKAVSSSAAHARVPSSLLYGDRSERAVLRLEQLLKAFKTDHWRDAYEICWSEFWDMHALFETSRPPFYYMTPDALLALRWLQGEWQRLGDGPIVTMDAGPNIHLLFRKDQMSFAEELLSRLPLRVRVIKSWGADA